HPVNLGPMREEVAKIRAEARNRIDAKINSSEVPNGTVIPPAAQADAPIPQTSAAPAPASHAEADNAQNLRQRPYLLGLIFLLLGVGIIYRLKRRQQPV